MVGAFRVEKNTSDRQTIAITLQLKVIEKFKDKKYMKLRPGTKISNVSILNAIIV